MTTPAFPAAWQPLVDRAAEAIRACAVDPQAKERCLSDPLLQAALRRVARRYVAGHTIAEALDRLDAMRARGHKGSAEYIGESVTDPALAQRETDVLEQLVHAVDATGHDCSISFDLSHVGSAIDPELGYRNARRIAIAAAACGREVMLSIEHADRTDLIYDTYRRLHDEAGLANVGITVPARRHRTARDLPRLLEYPGRIRLVKGAYHEGPDVALARNSPELAAAYRAHAATLLRSGHLCSIATHDRTIHRDLAALLAAERPDPACYEFESLDGLGTEQIDALRAQGFPTREYLVFGADHFLYVLNRIAEEPVRVYQAVLDLLAPGPDAAATTAAI